MLDSTELVHMNGRVFDPVIGRFVSADPFEDCGLETQGRNRYAYVGNQAVSKTDPTGFFSAWDDWGGGMTNLVDSGLGWSDPFGHTSPHLYEPLQEVTSYAPRPRRGMDPMDIMRLEQVFNAEQIVADLMRSIGEVGDVIDYSECMSNCMTAVGYFGATAGGAVAGAIVNPTPFGMFAGAASGFVFEGIESAVEEEGGPPAGAAATGVLAGVDVVRGGVRGARGNGMGQLVSLTPQARRQLARGMRMLGNTAGAVGSGLLVEAGVNIAGEAFCSSYICGGD